mmetsp:Transcript_35430/g.76984  ORF Transcript_35430/g.76984 Transcript_35430/m.76984 type:complete len:365 (-) Transcript_35430:4-1098(-)
MLAGANDIHHWRVAEHRAHRVRPAAERLAQHHHVRPGPAVEGARQHRAAPAQPRLNLVSNQQDVVLCANLLGALQILGRLGHDHPGLALDGLDHEGADVRIADGLLQPVERIVGNDVKARNEGAEVSKAFRVGAAGDGGDRAPPKVVRREDHLGRVRGHALHLVAPLPRQLHGGLAPFDARVHRKNLVVSEERGDVLFVLAELVVVKGAGGEAERLRLLHERGDDLRVAVALVHRRVGREAIQVLLALEIPNEAAFALAEHDGKRRVVRAPVPRLLRDALVAGARRAAKSAEPSARRCPARDSPRKPRDPSANQRRRRRKHRRRRARPCAVRPSQAHNPPPSRSLAPHLSRSRQATDHRARARF